MGILREFESIGLERRISRGGFPNLVEVKRFGLPEPKATETLGGVTFSIYEAKGLYSSRWSNLALKKLVGVARGGYQLYGDVPQFDKYDDKSAVYVVNSTYSQKDESGGSRNVEEWATLRFVPGSGHPARNEDLDFYKYHEGKESFSIIDILRERHPELKGFSEEEVLKNTVALSRLGSIRPYFENRGVDESLGTSSKFIDVNFALMNLQFAKDSQTIGFDPKLITSQIHDDLRTVLRMPFAPAYEVLETNAQSIGLDRENPAVYIRDVPAYFLHRGQLGSALRRLRQEGKLDPDLVAQYIPRQILEKEVRRPSFGQFTRAGELLRMLDSESWEFIKSTVGDGPELCLMNKKEWMVAAEDVVNQRNRQNGHARI